MSEHAYPEHEKLEAVQAESQAIGQFLDEGPYTLCVARDGRFWPVHKSISAILAEWFGIDQGALEQEKRAMLDVMRRGRSEA